MDEREALSLARKYADENNCDQVVYYYRLINESLLTEEDWFQYAKALHEASHSDDAIELLNTIILLNPEKDRFYSLRAHVKREIDLEQEALDDLNRAIQVNPENYYHWYTRALVHLDLGQLEEAVQDYYEAIQREDEETVSSTWYELGNVYMQLGESSKAIEAINKAIGDGSTSIPIYYARLAECYQDLDQVSQAAEAMEQAFEMSVYLYTLQDKGHQFIYQRGRYSNVAIETHQAHMLERYLYTHPLAELYEQLGRLDQAIDILTIGLEYFTDSSYLYQERARLRQKIGEKSQAIADLLQAQQLEPENDYIYYLLGAAYLEHQELDLALAYYNKAIRLDPEDDFYYLQRGTLLYSLGKYFEAERDYSKGIYLWEDACFYLKRALARLKLGKYKEALLDLQHAGEQDEELLESIVWIAAKAEALYNEGQFAEALELVNTGLALEPEHQELQNIRKLIDFSCRMNLTDGKKPGDSQ